MFVTDLGFSSDVLELLLRTEVEELDHLTKNPCVWSEDANRSEKYRKERGLDGYAISDLWNLDSHLNWLMASFCRTINSHSSSKLLDVLINLNECGEQNVYPFGPKPIDKEAQEAWKTLSQHATNEAEILFPSLYKATFAKTGEHALTAEQVSDVLKLIRTFKGTIINLKNKATEKLETNDVVIWEDVKHIIPSPTIVPSGEEHIHVEERGKRGYSRYDLENPRAFLAWIIVQGGLFFVSDKAHGTPGRFKTFTDWQIELLTFLEGIWIDAFTDAPLNPIAVKAFDDFTKILPSLWD